MSDLPDPSLDEPQPYRERRFSPPPGSGENLSSLGAFFFYFVLIVCILISVYLRLFAPPAGPKSAPIQSKITML